MSAPEESEPSAESEVHLPIEEVDAEEVSPAENTELQRIVELLPPEERAKVFGYIRQETTSHTSHRGWLPTPAFMREYEQVLPGLAERIVQMPEREQAYRHGVTTELIKRDYNLRKTGQWLGIVALVLIIAFCVFLAVLGGLAAAASVAGVTIVGTVGVFVVGQVAGKSGSSSKDLVEGDGSPTE